MERSFKLSQIGTVTETIQGVEPCRKARWGFVISHRPGESENAFMADFAAARAWAQAHGYSVEGGSRSRRTG